MRQLLTECAILSVIGGVAGLLLASWGVKVLVALSPGNIPRLQNVGIDFRVVLFTLGISLITSIVFGLVPALESSRSNLSEVLRDSGRGTTGGARSRRMRSIFVVSEMALAVVLLICSGLMIKSFIRIQSMKSGINAKNVLTFSVLLPRAGYKTDERRVAFFDELCNRVETLPGVQSAGAISFLPFSGTISNTDFKIIGRPDPGPGESPATDVAVIEPHYFRAMGIPLLKGRELTENDTGNAARVLIINETMAREYFPNEYPVGKHLAIDWDKPDGSEEIVGVAGDVRTEGLNKQPKPTIYWPVGRSAYSGMSMVIRTTGNPMNFVATVKDQVRAMDKDLPLADLKPMEDWLTDSVAQPRFNAQLLAIFAVVALILAAVGIYGVMSYSVSQRTNEIGIRIALGAKSTDVLGMVLGQGIKLIVIGLGTGVAGAFAMTRLLESLLYQISTTDPLTFVGISTLLGIVGILACYIPAARATRVDPMVALRYE